MEISISNELNYIISYSREEAMRTGSYGIAPDHLFLGILRHKENAATDTLRGLGTDMAEFKQFIDSKIFTNEIIPFDELENITFTRGTQNILSFAILEATKLTSPQVASQHLLLALCRAGYSFGSKYLTDTGITYNRIFDYLNSNGLLKHQADSSSEPLSADEEEQMPRIRLRAVQETPEEEKKNQTSPIEEFGYDITKAAQEGKLDPLVGRDEEIMRVIQILGRRRKNNAMLVGDPGVGKSAIVEGIAMKIASGQIPPSLANKRLISLDLGSIVAGTKYRGDFEKRLKSIINEVANNPDIILFIDEFHTIVGAGGTSGSLDAANMLKPALARGEIQCIGATTTDEFRKIVEKDGALNRRFQKITVERTDIPHTISILDKLKTNYERHHGVFYLPEAIEACVRMSERYITDRCLPDKAIDAMDEAGSMVKFNNPDKVSMVTAADVATVISRMTGVPAGKVARSEGSKLLKMGEVLKSSIIGQDTAVENVVRAIRRNRAGIKDPDKPIGTFLFMGPTGVGKTMLAKAIAEYLFDSESNLIRLDMSEYMEKFNVSRLIGAPPGYVGFEEGGQLSERVRRKPYCVVLLDEIEKAHPDVFNLLLQVMDEGRLTDSNGRTVSFRNTILIMTSNVGSRELDDYGSGVGFSTSGRNLEFSRKGIIEKAVRKVFPPEFINRVDEQIFFKPLTREDISQIIDIELKSLCTRIQETGYQVSIAPSVKNFVADMGFDPHFGARPLKRAIQRYIEDPVSEFIIADRMLDNKAVAKLKIVLNKTADNTIVRKERSDKAARKEETFPEPVLG